MVWLISLVYKGQKSQNILCLIAGLCYISAPELLHGMGTVYWHQSLLQVTLLLQIITFYKYITENSCIGKYLFYTLAISLCFGLFYTRVYESSFWKRYL